MKCPDCGSETENVEGFDLCPVCVENQGDMVIEFDDLGEWQECWKEEYTDHLCSQCGETLTFPVVWIVFDDGPPGDYLVHKHCLPVIQNKKLGPKLLAVDGWVRCVCPKNGKNFKYDELREFVGGYVEIVHPPGKTGAIMVVNEEGKLNRLPVNELASRVWQEGCDEDSQRANDPIVGPVLLCHTSQIE